MAYPRKVYWSYSWLNEQYTHLGKTVKQIAQECGCGSSAISQWLSRWNIPRRPIQGSMKGKKFTAEHKEKIRQSMLGRTSPMKGRTMTEEHKQKIGDAQRRENGHWWGVRGADHPNWKGGLKKKNHLLRCRREYEDWRKAVLERDGYACVNCLDYPEHPHVHHIIPFIDCPDELYKKSNGATLCGECHRHIHMTEY